MFWPKKEKGLEETAQMALAQTEEKKYAALYEKNTKSSPRSRELLDCDDTYEDVRL